MEWLREHPEVKTIRVAAAEVAAAVGVEFLDAVIRVRAIRRGWG